MQSISEYFEQQGVRTQLTETLEADIALANRIGIDGASIVKADVNPAGGLTITMSDGNQFSTKGRVVGDSGLSGIATPTTVPRVLPTAQLYVASGVGTYSNFILETGFPVKITDTNKILLLFKPGNRTWWEVEELTFNLVNYTLNGGSNRSARDIERLINTKVNAIETEHNYFMVVDKEGNICAKIVDGVLSVHDLSNELKFKTVSTLGARIMDTQDSSFYITDANGNVTAQIIDGVLEVFDLSKGLKKKVVDTLDARIMDTAESSFHITDSDGNVCLKIVNGVLDVFDISDRLKAKIRG